jgi:hypothetical protein
MTAAAQPTSTGYEYIGTHPEDTEQSALEVQAAIIHLIHYAPNSTCIFCQSTTD